jgi:hypothetical protein
LIPIKPNMIFVQKNGLGRNLIKVTQLIASKALCNIPNPKNLGKPLLATLRWKRRTKN